MNRYASTTSCEREARATSSSSWRKRRVSSTPGRSAVSARSEDFELGRRRAPADLQAQVVAQGARLAVGPHEVAHALVATHAAEVPRARPGPARPGRTGRTSRGSGRGGSWCAAAPGQLGRLVEDDAVVRRAVDADQQPARDARDVGQLDVVDRPHDDHAAQAVPHEDRGDEHVLRGGLPPRGALELALGPVPVEDVVAAHDRRAPVEAQVLHGRLRREGGVELGDVRVRRRPRRAERLHHPHAPHEGTPAVAVAPRSRAWSDRYHRTAATGRTSALTAASAVYDEERGGEPQQREREAQEAVVGREHRERVERVLAEPAPGPVRGAARRAFARRTRSTATIPKKNVLLDAERERHDEPARVDVVVPEPADEHGEVQRHRLERVEEVVEPLARRAARPREPRELAVRGVQGVPEDEEHDGRERRRERRLGERDRGDPGERGRRADERHGVGREAEHVRAGGQRAAERAVDEARVRGRAARGLLRVVQSRHRRAELGHGHLAKETGSFWEAAATDCLPPPTVPRIVSRRGRVNSG